jgi:hypothetical protein
MPEALDTRLKESSPVVLWGVWLQGEEYEDDENAH